MRKILLSVVFLSVVSAVIFTSCNKKETNYNQQTGELKLPVQPYEYFEGAGTEFNNAATLGRVLFYDRNLSKTNAIACASCHIQAHAFGDNKALSDGFENKKTDRNSIAIHNLGGSGIGFGGQQNLFWDGRSSNISDMVLQPSLNHIEMGLTSRAEITEKINLLSYYKPLFDKAGYDQITAETISDALVKFVTSIDVNNSKFDKVNSVNVPLAQFTALEQHGESIFNGKYNCNSCHSNPIFSYGQNAGNFVNIGLDKFSQDKGLMGVTNRESDRGRFKVPGLRNVQFSAPYMHDGRFKSLEEVIDHYSHGIQGASNLDLRLSDNGHAKQMNITDYDKKALVAFLNTLTDYDVLTHDRFSNPFKTQ